MMFLTSLFKKSEIDILKGEIGMSSKILVVGPMADYSKGDPTLPILIKVLAINPRNITVIDYQGSAIERLRGEVLPCYGNLKITAESVKRLSSISPHFVYANALSLPFKENSFDVIIDRGTHQFILMNNPKKMGELLSQYAKVLTKDGRLIFFCFNSGPPNLFVKLVKELSHLGFIVDAKEAKPLVSFKWKRESYNVAYTADQYIVAYRK